MLLSPQRKFSAVKIMFLAQLVYLKKSIEYKEIKTQVWEIFKSKILLK